MSGVPEGARSVGGGFYEVGGELHVDLEEFIVAAGGDPTSERDRATALRAIERELAAESPRTVVEVREKP